MLDLDYAIKLFWYSSLTFLLSASYCLYRACICKTGWGTWRSVFISTTFPVLFTTTLILWNKSCACSCDYCISIWLEKIWFYCDKYFKRLEWFSSYGRENYYSRNLRKIRTKHVLDTFLRKFLLKLKYTLNYIVFKRFRKHKLTLKSDSHLPKKYIFICFNKSPLKMMKNAFYFILKALFVLKIFKFLSWHFGHVEETA